MSVPAVRCEHVSKSYQHGRSLGIKELIVGREDPGYGRFVRQWAVRDASFEVASGRGFGIIGSNGSGKSTLLSILLGVLQAEEGRVVIEGRVASLLELGAGFHPDLTGRQNVFLYGSVLGMRLREIRARFDAIVGFSELGSAIDKPLRTYSSGMITRLGFSTIIHADADVLLIDEVLAVGDLAFQGKCIGFLGDFKARGGTLVIVTHDLQSVTSMCESAIYLDQGVVKASGDAAQVVARYQELASAGSDSA